MSRFYIITFNFFLFVVFASSAKLPKGFKQCKQSDPELDECLKVNVEDAMHQLKDGAPDLGVLPTDPLSVSEVLINGDGGPVTLNQTFKNLVMKGLSNTSIKKYKADLKNYRLTTEAFTPIIVIECDYDIIGRVLVLPIQGKGRANITLSDLTSEHDLFGERVEKKGKVYMHIKEYKIKLFPKLVHFQFDNLFNGDERLGSEMNKFLNENWEAVFNELKPSYEETYGLILGQISNQIFDKVPFNSIFLE